MTTTIASPEPAVDRGAVAPVWHTVLFLFVFTAVALAGKGTVHNLPVHGGRLRLYGATVLFEVAMVVYVWLLGLRLRGKTMRDLIGGRWSRTSDVLMDVAVALLFWMAVVAVLHFALGGNAASGLQAAEPLLPRSSLEMVAFVALAVTAGFCEEFLFRGYLQRQFLAWTGTSTAAVVLQAAVFGIGHLYQGWRNALTITVYGAMFGILALMRKSLRPGMIQHAMQDSFSGIVGSLLLRHGYF
jgi:membrane protease YdiL (CAAX protease family)